MDLNRKAIHRGHKIRKVFNLRVDEVKVVLASFAYFFCLLCGYYVLHPVRDAMGLIGGITNLQWLFAGTFAVMLVAVPIYGAICSRFKKSQFLPWVYLFFISNILIFYLVFRIDPENIWAARVFFIWVSVFNLFIISVFWSFMADVYNKEQGKRLFGLIAAGGSTGGIIGPLIAAALTVQMSFVNLLLVSAALLFAAVLLIKTMISWHRPMYEKNDLGKIESDKPMGGNLFNGFILVLRSPYLSGIGLFMILLTSVATFVYFQQAELISSVFESTNERTQVFALIDLIVNTIAIITQLFLTGRITKKIGVPWALALVPVLMIVGFIALAITPTLPVLIAAQVVRRAGNYAISRPAREMLWTVVGTEVKYKGKNFVDTVVYRGGDAASSLLYAGLAGLGLTLSGLALMGAVIAALWMVVALRIGRTYEKTIPPKESINISTKGVAATHQ